MNIMEEVDVKAMEIRDYAICRGWQLVKEALKDGLFVLNSPSNDFTQLIFPKEDSVSEYQEMAAIALKRLSEFYGTPRHKLAEEIREVNDDVISLRYFSDNKTVNSISFQEAIDSIDATKKMLLAAASSAVNPVIFHPKLNRTEAQDLVKKARFRHTEEGSFILKISVPSGLTPRTNLPVEVPVEKPFSRKTLEIINRSAISLTENIDSNTIEELYESQVQSASPFLSYNFCDAVSKLFDEERELPFQLIFNWSKASALRLPIPPLPQRVTFPFSQKSKIEEVREYFAPRRKDLQGTFVATVETLDGDPGEDGRRSGTVVLSVLFENEIIKVRVDLPGDFYDTAIQAHKNGSTYVEVSGILKRSRSSHSIEKISQFKILTGSSNG